MVCVPNKETEKVFQALKKLVPSNNKFTEYKVKVWINGGFTPEFSKWYKDTYKRGLDEPTTRIDSVARRIIIYYNSQFGDVSATAETFTQDEIVSRFGYTDLAARDFAVRSAGTILLDIWNNLNTSPISIGGNVATYYANQLQHNVNELVLARLAQIHGTSIEDERTSLLRNANGDVGSYLVKRFGDKEILDEDKNLIALYREVNSTDDHLNVFMKEILYDKRMASVYNDTNKEFNDAQEEAEVQQETLETEPDSDGAVATEDSTHEVDLSILQYNSHDGQYKTFTMHISERVRNYFNSLRKLSSPNKVDGSFIENTDTPLGIADTMTAESCASMMYNHANFKNLDEMIEEVKKISRQVPGFESFAKFASDLEEDLDFATEVCTIFLKSKMNAIEVRKQNDSITTTQSNPRVDPNTALLYDLVTDLKGTSLNIDFGYVSNVLNKDIDTFNKIIKYFYSNKGTISDDLRKEYETAIKRFKDIILAYFPTINESAIDALLDSGNRTNNRTINQVYQAIDFSKILLDLVSVSEKIALKTEDIERRAREAKQKDSNADVSSIYGEDVIDSDDWLKLVALRQAVMPYMAVNTDLNSRNIKGNNQSQIMNNNLLTQLDKMLTETAIDENGKTTYPTLLKWGQERVNIGQYKYNALLFPQYNERGELINTPLFNIINGQVVLATDNPSERIKLYKYIGSSNIDASKNLAYTDMVQGSFAPTSYIQYFEGIPKNDYSLSKSPLGVYFLRTPSDAPQPYCVAMPRINTASLVTYLNYEKEQEKAKSIFRSFALGQDVISKYAKTVDVKGNKHIENPIPIEESVIVDAITKNAQIWFINKNVESFTDKETGKTYYVFAAGLPNEDDNPALKVNKTKDAIHLIVEGTPTIYNDSSVLDNYEIVGIYQNAGQANTIQNFSENSKAKFTIMEEVSNYYMKELLRHDVTVNGKTFERAETTIDRNHPVVRRLLNEFKQELLNAAIALDHYCVTTPNGKVDTTTGRVNTKADITKGYKFYHIDGKGVIEDVNDDENNFSHQRLTGKVFGSNKFTMHFNGKTVNYMDSMFSETRGIDADEGVINFLYGGDTTYLHVRKDNDKVVDVILTPAQERKAIDNIVTFVRDYIDKEYDYINQYSEFIDKPTDYQAVTDYAINHLLSMYNYDVLFEGDTKFYKDSQTILKRAKEYQGSGVPLGLSDYTRTDGDLGLSMKSFIDDGIINKLDENGKVILDDEGRPETMSVREFLDSGMLKGLTIKTSFKGVTIKNTQKTHEDTLNELEDKLVSIFKKQGIKEEKARNKAKNILRGPEHLNEKTGKFERTGGFQNTKVNDAQSYITFDEWVRRIIARGQFKKYYPLIKKLSDPNSELTVDDVSEFVQVQKNFYYDLHYDERYDVFVPRQIKNAELVLHPRFVQGTELEHVYNAMKKAGIDQLNTVETSKAANEEVLTLWDNDGVMTKENLDNFIAKAPEVSQDYNYNNLYLQIDTKQHLNARNKAGIQLMKKILDNIPNEGHPLSDAKQRLINNYIANIKHSFMELMSEYEIEIDDDGNFIVDENGNIGKLNQAVVFDKLSEELMRRGVDTNMLDYVTLEDGQPKMPITMSNTLVTLESIFQSMFNNSITNQKLPGLHGVQVTQVGWRKFSEDEATYVNSDGTKMITKNQYDKLSKDKKKNYHDRRVSYSKDLRYHPDGKGYIEIKLPLKHFGISRNHPRFQNPNGKRMTDAEIDAIVLKELEEQGLDKVIGYRIPTEGKQSVCVMKVVGFVPDAMGSSIIVPDDWVSQTGSDFDVDSIYCVGFNTYIKNNTAYKIKYIGVDTDGKKKPYTIFDYFTYLRNHKIKVSVHASEHRKSVYDKHSKLLDDEYEKLKKIEKKKWDAVWEIEKDEDEDEAILRRIKAAHAENASRLEGQSKKDVATANSAITIEIIRDYIDTNDAFRKQEDGPYSDWTDEEYEETFAPYRELLEASENLNNFANGRYDELKGRVAKEVEDYFNDILDKAEEDAQEVGLLTYNKFIDANVEDINSKEARDNMIAQSMIDILEHELSLEENLSRSNFDDIIAARDAIMSKSVKEERNGRSPYIISDQIAFQEDAMSGYVLKGMSVALDSLCSVCNMVKPNLAKKHSFVVYYRPEDIDVDAVKKSFNVYDNDGNIIENNVEEVTVGKTKYIKVNHNKYGWTNDYYNVSGKILTSYSSQTTAHILDAIKEGAIPGVNTYTFSTYKTLVNAGSDYTTSVAFIMQPGVDKIVQSYNRTNSVFSDNYKVNPIHGALRDIATELGIKVSNTSSANNTLELISKNKEINKRFKEIFGKELDIMSYIGSEQSIPINVDLMIKRINEQGIFSPKVSKKNYDLNRKVFDLGMMLVFDKLHDTADDISRTGRCCNPDKFGAKQTIFETNKVFEEISAISKQKSALVVGDKSMVASIYPGAEKGVADFLKENNIEDSTHKPMYAFLKYASASSIAISCQIIPTQRKGFVDTVNGICGVFSGGRNKLTPDQFKDVKMYLLKYIYGKSRGIVLPLEIKGTNKNMNISYTTSIDESKYDSLVYTEACRIYGIGVPAGRKYYDKDGNLKEFSVKDVRNPTKQECEDFCLLSPAQKVQFIKSNFRNRGIFEYIQPNTSKTNGRTWRSGLHTMSFNENAVNPNVAFTLFKQAFYNKNMLVKLAAFDIVKYGVVFEGMRMRATAVNKVIDNLPLRESFGNNGTGLVDTIDEAFSKITDVNNYMSAETIAKFYEYYLRSHPDAGVVKTYKSRKNRDKLLGLKKSLNSMFVVEAPINKDGDVDMSTYNDNCMSLGIKERDKYSGKPVNNSYVRIVTKAGNNLYKCVHFESGCLLYPLNKLMENETTEISVNPNFNRFLDANFYRLIEERLIKTVEGYTPDNYVESLRLELSQASLNYIIDSININQFKHKTEDKKSMSKVLPNLMEEAEVNHTAKITVDQIYDTLKDNEKGFIRSSYLSHFNISSDINNPEGPITIIKDGVPIKFKIVKWNMNNYIKSFVYHDDEIKVINPVIKKALDIAKDNYKKNKSKIKIDDIFAVARVYETPKSTEVANESEGYNRSASLIDASSATIKYAERLMSTGHKAASDFIYSVRQQNITNNTNDIEENAEFVMQRSSDFYYNQAKALAEEFNAFLPKQNATGEYYKLSDKEVQELIKMDISEQNRYMGLLNRIKDMRDKIANYDLSIDTSSTTEDDPMGNMKFKGYIERIKKAKKTLDDLDTLTADKNLMEGFLKDKSNHPLVKLGMLSLTENFHNTYGSMWKFHDIMESGNTLLQVILTDVMNNLEARRMRGEKIAREFRNHLKDIRKRAAAAGKTINADKFITKDWHFVQDFKHTLVDDFTELQKKVTDSGRTYGYGSIEHLKAKYNLERFKYIHFKQPAKDTYYRRKLKLELKMITDYPKIFGDYMKLNYKRINYYRAQNDTGLTPEEQRDLNNISSEITSILFGDDDKYSYEERAAISDYIKKIGKLNSETFKDVTAPTFQAQLEMYLAIIERAENPDKYGIPQTDQEILASNSIYQQALEWVKNNAYKAFTSTQESFEFRQDRDSAIRAFGVTKNGIRQLASNILAGKKRSENCYDYAGVPDGRKVVEEDRKELKRAIEGKYNISASNPFADAKLISLAPAHNYMFSKEFYESMTSNGAKSIEWSTYAKKINDVLIKYVDSTGRLSFESMIPIVESYNKIDTSAETHTPEEEEVIERYESFKEDLKILSKLYKDIRATRKTTGSTNGAQIKEFIDKNVDTKVNQVAYDINVQIYRASQDNDFKRLWLDVNCNKNEDGRFVDKDGNVITIASGKLYPNTLLYGYMEPKSEVLDKYLDKNKTAAVAFMDKYFRKVPTKYYAIESMRVRKEAETANDPNIYRKWWEDNHVYNPYTHKYELLDIWVKSDLSSKVLEDYGDIYQWVPKGSNVTRDVDNGMRVNPDTGEEEYFPANDQRNPDYDEEAGFYGNYRKGSENGKYDDGTQLNEFEKEMRDYMQDMLISHSSHYAARRFYKKGNLPFRPKEKDMAIKDYLIEASKLLGFNITTNNGNATFYDDIESDADIAPGMAMTQMLVDPDRTEKFELPKPDRNDSKYKVNGMFDEESYNKDLDEWKEAKRVVDEKNEQIHQDMLDRNYEDVIEDYLLKANHYNAIRENKDKLYYLLKALENQRGYIRKYGAMGDLKKDDRAAYTDDNGYVLTHDGDLVEQYKTTLRRILFDQWKEAEGPAVKVANQLQGFTSANYMMLNIKGGIANVTLGGVGMLSEAIAREFIGSKEMAFGTGYWSQNVISFMRGMYTKTATTKADAIVKFFNVVDYDEITGTVRTFSPKVASERLRDLMFSPQTAGEHFMQNSVLFGMLKSHKIIKNPYTGEYTFMNFREYCRMREYLDLSSVLTREQKEAFKAEIDRISKDANEKKNYVWFRRDVVTDFALFHMNKAQRDTFKNIRKDNREKYKKEFEDIENIFDQLELGEDGYLAYKEGSLLSKLDDKDNPININQIGTDKEYQTTIADRLMGGFSERVKKTNNKIHGVYNKMGAAYIERKWYGSLIMQYHKHLPFGLLKRYRARGFFSETRGAVEKGMYKSIEDFLSLNFESMAHDLNIDINQKHALQSVQIFIAHAFEYCMQIRETWSLLPQYEKDNVRRSLAGLAGTAAALMATLGLLAMGAGDDDDDRIVTNLALYEADRLASETFMYTLPGIFTETKKLMSTPIAAESIVNDLTKTLTEISSLVLYGEDSSVYKSGRFAGQSKYTVFIKRRIPGYASINSILNIPENNHYFKMGKNSLGYLPTKSWAESIRTTFE